MDVAKSGKGDDVKNRNNVYDSPTRVYDRMKNPCVSLNQSSVEDVPEYVSPRFKRNPRDSILYFLIMLPRDQPKYVHVPVHCLIS